MRPRFRTLTALAVALASVGLAAPAPTNAGPTDLIPGQVFTSGLTGPDAGYVVVEDSAGRLVVGGSVRLANSHTEWALTRFLADGRLDTTFGTDGLIVTAPITAGTNIIEAMVIDSSDRVVASGRSATGDIVVRRYAGDGELDTTFGTGGTTRIDLGATEMANAIALDSTGRIVVAAQLSRGYPDSDVVVARLTDAGAPDTSFNSSGHVITDVGSALGGARSYDVPIALAIDDTDRPLVGGASPDGQWLMMRYTPSGILDTSFDSDGIRRIDHTNQTDYVIWMGIDTRGRILAGGYYGSGGGSTSGLEKFVVARFNADGSDDTSYGTNGLASLDVNATVREVPTLLSLDPDGSVTITGTIMNHSVTHDAVVLTFDPDGQLDTSIASDGLRYIVTDSTFLPNSAVRTADGVVYAGYAYPAGYSSPEDVAIHLVPADVTAPTVTVTDTTVTSTDGTIDVTVSETGTAYLIDTSLTVTDESSITTADDTRWNSVAIATATAATPMPLAGLANGTYTVRAVDTTGNMSAATGTITIAVPSADTSSGTSDGMSGGTTTPATTPATTPEATPTPERSITDDDLPDASTVAAITPTDLGAPAQITSGATLTVEATGFTADEDVVTFIASHRRILDRTIANATGSVSSEFTVPAELTGEQTVVLWEPATDTMRAQVIEVTQVVLPATGTSLRTAPTMLPMLLIGVGILGVLVRRRA